MIPRHMHTGAMNVLASLLESRTGQQIAANRAWRIETALKPVMRARGIEDLDALVAQVLSGRGTDLADDVVDAMLNQESSFFRDAGVLEQVAASVAEVPGRARIWSAGCSTGQEPLSLAMLFTEACEAHPTLTFPEIIATDVSEPVLTKARAGHFSQFEVQRGLPIRRMLRWFEQEGSEWVAAPDLVKRVAYRKHNLVADRPPVGRFDAILCRNVLLYFSAAQRRQVFDCLMQALRPGGILVLGAGETVIGQTDYFCPSQRHRGFYELAAPAPSRTAATA
ncbi:protein-glutamate O-methyltransferase CheR [soil metagenome]